jgi:hypothetical protein
MTNDQVSKGQSNAGRGFDIRASTLIRHSMFFIQHSALGICTRSIAFLTRSRGKRILNGLCIRRRGGRVPPEAA